MESVPAVDVFVNMTVSNHIGKKNMIAKLHHATRKLLTLGNTNGIRIGVISHNMFCLPDQHRRPHLQHEWSQDRLGRDPELDKDEDSEGPHGADDRKVHRRRRPRKIRVVFRGKECEEGENLEGIDQPVKGTKDAGWAIVTGNDKQLTKQNRNRLPR